MQFDRKHIGFPNAFAGLDPFLPKKWGCQKL